jgi:hypothetical protein
MYRALDIARLHALASSLKRSFEGAVPTIGRIAVQAFVPPKLRLVLKANRGPFNARFDVQRRTSRDK